MPAWAWGIAGVAAVLLAWLGLGVVVVCDFAAAMDDDRPSHLD